MALPIKLRVSQTRDEWGSHTAFPKHLPKELRPPTWQP